MPSTVRDRTKEFFATINSFQTFNTIETVNVSLKHTTSSPQYIQQSQRIHDLTVDIDAKILNVEEKKLKHIEQC